MTREICVAGVRFVFKIPRHTKSLTKERAMRDNLFLGYWKKFSLNGFMASSGRTRVAMWLANYLCGAVQREMRLAVCIAAAALVLLGSLRLVHAAPVVVNAQLNDFEDEGGNTRDPYTGQGALATADAHDWNDLPIFQSSTFTGLVDSSGAANGATLDVNGDGFSGIQTGNFLLDGTRSVGPGTGIPLGTFTIGGLTPNATYNLYLYGYGQENTQANPVGFGGTFDITSGAGSNPNPQTTSGALLVSGTDYTSSSISTSALGKAYVVYAGLIPNSSGQITGTYSSVFNGFQLQGPFGVVPEPGTLSVLSIAAIGLLARRRR
jgi:hypothetical protein